ncbi:MAG: DUF805 domain-containing protein [Rubrivivax sp.]|nr:DUF805 domain-containing protein [Rubrivivax sp.]
MLPSTPGVAAVASGAGDRAWPDGDPDAPWRMLFSAEGRISRQRFWMRGVGAMLGLGLVLHGLLAVARVRMGTAEPLVDVVLLWPALVISIKRWHDRDCTGWWVLLAFVPVIGWIWLLLANGLLAGSPGANRYGEPPPQWTSSAP